MSLISPSNLSEIDDLFNEIRHASIKDILDMVKNAGGLPGTFAGGSIPTSINEAIANEVIDNLMNIKGK